MVHRFAESDMTEVICTCTLSFFQAILLAALCTYTHVIKALSAITCLISSLTKV